MQKPNAYDSVSAKQFSGSPNPVAPGAYVLGIVKAEITTSSNKNEMLVLSLDIAKGEYHGRFRELSDNVQKDCLLKHYRLTDSETSLPYFKGDIKAIEESNQGFVFNFDEKTLRGKLVGGMLAEEEYEKKDGTIGTSLKVAFLCSVATAESGKLQIPKKKEICKSHNVYDDEPPLNDEDLPF